MPSDPLNEPVWVVRPSPWAPVTTVRPTDVLAALTDEQRDAMVERAVAVLARVCDGTTVEQEKRIARAVVAALCGVDRAA